LVPLPCTEEIALLYIAHLDKCKLASGTIRVYMSALRSLHIQEGYMYDVGDSQRLQRALRAVTINGPAPTQKLPITYDLLSRMRGALPIGHDGIMQAAAMSLAFFGCLRAAELCVQDNAKFDPVVNLCIGDVSFHTTPDEVMVCVRIKKSKTDTTNAGFSVYIACIRTPVCAHCCLQLLVASRLTIGPTGPSHPLFLHQNGRPLHKSEFVRVTKNALASVGVDPSGYSGHSYRAGAATSGAEAGLADYELQLLGRWTSDAYQRYIRAPPTLLSRLAHRLASSTPALPQRTPKAVTLFGPGVL
jgi:integrase